MSTVIAVVLLCFVTLKFHISSLQGYFDDPNLPNGCLLQKNRESPIW